VAVQPITRRADDHLLEITNQLSGMEANQRHGYFRLLPIGAANDLLAGAIPY
jgi:hypothetical protein